MASVLRSRAPVLARVKAFVQSAARAVSASEGPLTIAAAVEMFFGDLRLAPRSKKTYRNGVAKFLRHLEVHEGIDANKAPVSALSADHVTSFATLIVPVDIRTPEEVSQMLFRACVY